MLCSLHSHRDIPVFQQVFQSEKYHLPVKPVISHTGGTAIFASTAFYKLHGILDNIFHIIINLFSESKSTHILIVKIDVYVRACVKRKFQCIRRRDNSNILLFRHGHHPGSIFQCETDALIIIVPHHFRILIHLDQSPVHLHDILRHTHPGTLRIIVFGECLR